MSDPCEKCAIREDKDYPCAATEHDQQDCVRACSWKEAQRDLAREVVEFSRDQRNPEMRVDQFVAKYGASDVWETGYVANDIEDWLRSKRLLEEGK